MYQQDWLLRQIETIVRIIGRFIFKKEIVEYVIVEEPSFEATNFLYRHLLRLLEEGKINEAENTLFTELDKNNLNYLRIGLDFYTRLNKLSEDELLAFDFSRTELKTGLEDLGKFYGLNPFYSLIEEK